MPYLTRKQITEVDRVAINEYGVQIEKLMENAGREMARFVSEFNPKKVLVLYGKGNNGGDGLVCARHLAIYGFDVSILGAEDDKDLNIIARKELKVLKKMGVEVSGLSEMNRLKKGDIIIDGLIGYNLNGNPRGKYAELIRWANESKKKDVKIFCYDVPSGLNVDNGKKANPCIDEDYVLALAVPKKGLKKMKNVYVANIGIPNEVYEQMGIKVENWFKDSDIIRVS